LLKSTTNAWVIPALYPAKPCSLGPSLISGQESNLGVWLTARFLGEYACEPCFGRLLFGMILPLFSLRESTLCACASFLLDRSRSAPPTVTRYPPSENGVRGEIGMQSIAHGVWSNVLSAYSVPVALRL